MSDNAFGGFFIGDADEDIPAQGQGVISVPLVVPEPVPSCPARTGPVPTEDATRPSAHRAPRASSGWC